jgi:uncharacterized protein YwgA
MKQGKSTWRKIAAVLKSKNEENEEISILEKIN